MGHTPDPHWREVARLACSAGHRISAVGPGAVDRHLDHAQGLAAALDPAAVTGLDLGTGVGLPGLALAGLRPDMSWTLLDAALRRVRVLAEVVDEAGWADRVTVVHGRAEEFARTNRRAFDVVVARLFGSPAVTAECAAPLVGAGGQVLVSDVDGGAEITEARWPAPALAPLGLSVGRRFSSPTVQELRSDGVLEDRFPRKPGVAARRPLWHLSDGTDEGNHSR